MQALRSSLALRPAWPAGGEVETDVGGRRLPEPPGSPASRQARRVAGPEHAALRLLTGSHPL